ncbi:MAG: hypothetical protein ETSY1_46840 (plasmid) [Candidatus Entotheonella factor]|uniref:Uncharacterized protein n=1 Tax=Entotheonella factor TaxID=1429438 RepID=W4M1P3_ENTF1|nr:MAG: hypothetical protein ETSY1_46840 [Candidatus Entotheonella factor]
MSLNDQIGDLTQSTDALTQEVRQLIPQWDSRVGTLETQVQSFIEEAAASFPVASNLLPDSKNFDGLCQGQKNVRMAWDEGGLGHPWHGIWLGATGSLFVEVVYVGDEARLTELGLWPLGPLNELVRPFAHPTLGDYGQDSHIAIFDLGIHTWTKGQPVEQNTIPFTFQMDCREYTSWWIGQFKTQQSSFMNVLSANHLAFNLFRNRAGYSPEIGADAVGLGWKHYAGALTGFGGCNSSYVVSDIDVITPQDNAHIKFALALPYQGFGWHHGIPVWAGFNGRWDVGDAVAP